MNYELGFYVLVAFCLGRMSVFLNIYIGQDINKYNNATFGILLKKK